MLIYLLSLALCIWFFCAINSCSISIVAYCCVIWFIWRWVDKLHDMYRIPLTPKNPYSTEGTKKTSSEKHETSIMGNSGKDKWHWKFQFIRLFLRKSSMSQLPTKEKLFEFHQRTSTSDPHPLIFLSSSLPLPFLVRKLMEWVVKIMIW